MRPGSNHLQGQDFSYTLVLNLLPAETQAVKELDTLNTEMPPPHHPEMPPLGITVPLGLHPTFISTGVLVLSTPDMRSFSCFFLPLLFSTRPVRILLSLWLSAPLTLE